MHRFRPRVYVHPDRYGATKTKGPNRLLVVHTSEGGETYSAAENLCSYMGTPGDKPSSNGGFYGASYQYVTDTDESVIPATWDNVVAYAAAGANHDGIHFCIPGKAGQTRAQWLDADSTAHIRSLAWGMQQKAAEFSIPLRKLSVAEVKNGAWGYCGHHDVSLAFGLSTHTDPGAQFPWDFLGSLVAPPSLPPTGGLPVAERLKIKGYRLYDSRSGDGKLHGERQLGILDPEAAGALAAQINITVTQTEGGYAEFLSVWDSGPFPGTSKMNWDGFGQTVANEVLVPLSGYGTFQVKTSAPTHFVIDVVGYWMP